MAFAEDQGKNVTTAEVHNSTLVTKEGSARHSRHFGGDDKKGGGGYQGGGYGYGYGYPPPQQMPCCPCYGGGNQHE